MGDMVITILLFCGVMAVTAVLFGGWVLVSVFRFFTRTLGGNAVAPSGTVGERYCPNEQCRTLNPGQAKFCRRCGRAFPPPQRVAVRRAAMW